MPVLGIGFGAPYYEGIASTTEAPSRYEVAIGGRGYRIDRGSGQHRWQSIPLLRNQVDDGDRPGERSLNPEAGWLRAQESWHLGAGQDAYDRDGSDPARFAASKGVDPWTPWELGLLPATTEVVDSANTNLRLAVTGTRMWLTNGSGVSYTDDGSSWSAATYTGGTPVGIASDGTNVYVTDGADIYRCASSATDFSTAWNTLDADTLAFVNGRLMAAHEDDIYEIVTSAAPSSHFTHPHGSAAFVDFAEGPNAIYAAAQDGDKALIYRIGIDLAAGTLDEPIIAATFTGEEILAIHGYANTVLLIGTDDGFRVATFGADGQLEVGALVDTGQPVRCFTGWQNFVWFGWDDFDADNSGLGRIDLSRFTTDLNVFAYASDLMADDDGEVASVVTFAGERYFAVDGAGVYAESATLVETGWFTTGEIAYGLAGPKTAETVTLAGDTTATVTVEVSTDGGAYASLGTIGLSTATSVEAGQRTAERFELRCTVDRGSAASVKLRRWTLESEPQSSSRYFVFAPLLISETEEVEGGAAAGRDVAADIDFVIDLWAASTVTTWQEGSRRFPVRIVDFEWSPTNRTRDGRAWNGTLLVKMKKV